MRNYARSFAALEFLFTAPDFAGYGGDRGAATSARLNSPVSITSDFAGGLYIADRGNSCVNGILQCRIGTCNRRRHVCCSCVRRLLANKTIVTAAGKCGAGGTSGNYGPATSGTITSLPRSRGFTDLPSVSFSPTRRSKPVGANRFSTGWQVRYNSQSEYRNMRLHFSFLTVTRSGGFVVTEYYNNYVRQVRISCRRLASDSESVDRRTMRPLRLVNHTVPVCFCRCLPTALLCQSQGTGRVLVFT